jgi:hypothetical protein
MPAFNHPAVLRALAVWLLIILAETAQGGLREWLAGPGADFAVRQAAVAVSVAVIFAITWACHGWMRLGSAAGALAVGAGWAALTVAFEFILGRALGLGWDRILEDYDVTRGGLMPLGLVAMALTPWLVLRLRGRTAVAEGGAAPAADPPMRTGCSD